MKVTRDVITDLLPLLASGEASADTRAIVEEYLRADPEFAATVKAASEERMDTMLKKTSARPSDNVERAALDRSRALLRRRSWTMGLAFLFTMLPFSFAFINSGINFLMIRDAPQAAMVFGVVAVLLWTYYWRLQRQLRVTGL